MDQCVEWYIPSVEDQPALELRMNAGDVVLFVGSNGSGKSALSYWLANRSCSRPIRRIFAQRQVWLPSASPEITFSQRETYSRNFSVTDAQPQSRVKDPQGGQRSATLLFDLLAKVNQRNARLAECVDEGAGVEGLSQIGPSLLTIINDLMKSAGFRQQFRVGENNAFVARLEGETYPISDMSDGEKSAFLLASEVLLADEGSVLVIDEPERHLHRSISARFITALTEVRNDCIFVLFTHDVDLMALGLKTILVRSVNWQAGQASGWHLEELESVGDRKEQVRLALLGSRGRILVTEGELASLDKSLYQIVFPEWTVHSVGGNEQVIRTVSGLREASPHHWVDATGVIDGDCRSAEEREKLRGKGILVLPVNEVENLYYLPFIVEYHARKQADALGGDFQERLSTAQSNALRSLERPDVKENLAAVNAVKIVRHEALRYLPSSKEELRSKEITWTISSPLKEEFNALCKALSEEDHEAILVRFSIRESGYGSNIANGLGYRNERDYQAAVRASLKRDSEFLQEFRKIIGSLTDSV
ncbi:AAA family ATPase [Glutamicibacter sp. X7]